MVVAYDCKTTHVYSANITDFSQKIDISRMPNKCLAPGDSGIQHDSMITKKYICILAGASLFVSCYSPWTPGPKPNSPTPAPTTARTQKNKRSSTEAPVPSPGPKPNKPTPTPPPTS